MAANTSSFDDKQAAGRGPGAVGEAAKRYAGAAFDLALDVGAVDAVETGLNALAKLVNTDAALRRALRSPLYGAADKQAVLAQLAEKLGVHDLVRRFIGVIAQNGRAGDVPEVARAFAEKAARHRGAQRALARVAQPLTRDQELDLQSAVSKALGRTVEVEVEVDPALLGGMQLKLGSRLIDASVRTKLKTLTNIMKGA